MCERLKHLQGGYRPAAHLESTSRHQAQLEALMGCAIPDDVWEVIQDVGGVFLQHCFVQVDGVGTELLEAFKTAKDVCHMLANFGVSPPDSVLPLAVGGGGWFCVVLQGAMRDHVVFWSLNGRARTVPGWLETIQAEEQASWGDVWRVAPTIDAFLGQIRFRPTPNFESARLRSIALAVLAGGSCELVELHGRPAARSKTSPRWGSPASSISFLSPQEMQDLGGFLGWHQQYQTETDAPLPDFVGPKGLRAIQQPAGVRERLSAGETLQAVAEAIRANDERLVSLEVFVSQTYGSADFSLSLQGALSPNLPVVRLFEGALRGLRTKHEPESCDEEVQAFDDAVAAVEHLLYGPILGPVLRDSHGRNRKLRCTVYGPYEEEPVEVPIR